MRPLRFIARPPKGAARRLQLGSFNNAPAGWVNTDVTPHIAVARIPGAARALRAVGRISDARYGDHRTGVFRRIYYLDVSRPFPYEEAAFDYVFTSHMLEHLHPDDGTACMAEVHRVLRPGGLVRVGIPDLDLHVERYDPRDPDALLSSLYSYQSGSREPSHRWWYNEHSLAALFEGRGSSSGSVAPTAMAAARISSGSTTGRCRSSWRP